jgi:hypothetical protein
MRRRISFCLCLAVLGLSGITGRALSAQRMTDGVISDHIRLRLPLEREWLGRDIIAELERCWLFMNAVTVLPRTVLVVLDWNQADSSTSYSNATLVLGMKEIQGGSSLKATLLHFAAREMARLGLLTLARGSPATRESVFLYEGMAEILAHDYERTSRSLEGAWIVAQFLERMKLLKLQTPAARPIFVGGNHDLITGAPAITFLLSCRELYGSERVLKLFESLRKSGLQEALRAAFRTDASVVEENWMQKVRDHVLPGSTTGGPEKNALALQKAVFAASAGSASGGKLKLYMTGQTAKISPNCVFVEDQGREVVRQARAAADEDEGSYSAELPFRVGGVPQRLTFLITVVQEGGTVVRWTTACGEPSPEADTPCLVDGPE